MTDPAPGVRLPLTTRPRAYGMLLGAVGGLLAIGLIVPIAVGERVDDTSPVRTDELDLGRLGQPEGDQPVGLEHEDDSSTDGPDPEAGDPSAPASEDTPAPEDAPAPAPERVPGDGGTAPETSVALTASDVGVTPTSIKVGLLVPTADGIGSTQEQSDMQVAEFMAFIDEVNDGGGIHGRRIEVVVANYDILDQGEGARAACLRLAEDERVFAVFNTTGFGPPGALCLTREKGVPFLQGSGHPDEVYAQSNGLYSSTFDSQTRNLANMVTQIHKLGVIDGKKVGILGTQWIGQRRQQEEGMIEPLRQLGYEPFVYWLSGDPVSSQSQVPIAVQQMRSNGVEVILLGADFISGGTFVQQANAQRYWPTYAAADPWGWSTDYVVDSMPASFEGAITVTAMRTYDARIGVAEPAIDARCRETFESSTGIELDRADDPYALYIGTMWACGVVQRFTAAANAAGPELTRRRLMQAIGGLGTVEVPFAGGPATYSATKLDGVDHYRPQRWQADCRCWHPLVPHFSPGRHW